MAILNNIAKIYLFSYNLVLFLGWSTILVKTLISLAKKPYTELYQEIVWELNIFQTAAILEIVHCFFGLVRSPLMTTAMQVFSRLMIVWPIAHSVVEAQSSVGVPLFVLAWSVTEIIRYSFYALTLIDCLPYFLLWLRYSLFVVLYPMGVTGELTTVISALPSVKERKIFTVEMPNPANISFNYYYMLLVFMLLYLPFFPQLYFYMFSQRQKYLSTEMKKKKE